MLSSASFREELRVAPIIRVAGFGDRILFFVSSHFVPKPKTANPVAFRR